MDHVSPFETSTFKKNSNGIKNFSINPSNRFLKIWDSNSQNGSSFGSVWAHSLTLSCIPMSVTMTLGLHFQFAPFHALAFVVSPMLGL
jgi:hypothetical protein